MLRYIGSIVLMEFLVACGGAPSTGIDKTPDPDSSMPSNDGGGGSEGGGADVKLLGDGNLGGDGATGECGTAPAGTPCRSTKECYKTEGHCSGNFPNVCVVEQEPNGTPCLYDGDSGGAQTQCLVFPDRIECQPCGVSDQLCCPDADGGPGTCNLDLVCETNGPGKPGSCTPCGGSGEPKCDNK